MKIVIKAKDFKFKLPIYVPLRALIFILKRLEGKDNKYLKSLEGIDMKVLADSLHILREYRGLQLVDVKASDGTEVRIII